MKLKKSLSLILALTLLLSCLGITASAETDFSTWTEITGPTTIETNGNYYLNSDVTGDITVNSGVEATLDLNGHVLKGAGTEYVGTITVKGNLTLRDSNPTATHSGDYETLPAGGVVTGGWFGVYLSANAGSFTMKNGTISGNERMGVYLSANAGSFTMENGTISGNGRRGVRVDAGSFTMENGTISGNGGGGVLVNAGSFTMKDGTISGNSTQSEGGGVLASDFIMTGGTISGNSAGYYGGVFADNITIGGTAKIYDNTASEAGNNLAVYSPFALGDGTTVAKPANGMKVGVTSLVLDEETETISESVGKFTTNGEATDVQYFFSDNENYEVKYNEGGYLKLVAAYAVTCAGCTNGTISVGNQASAYEDEKVTVTATPDDGYKLDTLSATYNDGTTDQNLEITNNSFTMPAYAVTVSATFSEKPTSGTSDLDLEDSTTDIPESTTIDQYYTKVDARQDNYTCKIGYSIISQNIKIRVSDAKIWNPSTLKWEKDTANNGKATLVDGSSVTVKLTNYSAKAYTCALSFAANSSDSLVNNNTTPTFKNNSCTLEAVANDVEKMTTDDKYFTDGSAQTTVDSSELPTATIEAEVAIANIGSFDNATAGTADFGTFTITCTPVTE